MNKVIMIMVDGFGIPPAGIRCPVYNNCCTPQFLELLDHYSTPIDANLELPTLPQSATGQCSLFCGINAAAAIERHLPGFPNAALREIIRQQNIFKTLRLHGAKVTFANAYINHTLAELKHSGLRSVTTVMTDNELGQVRNRTDLLAGKAVLHDITREYLTGALNHLGLSKRLATMTPVLKPELAVTPEHAAHDLLTVAAENDFTLFEFFMSDRAGHRQHEPLLKHVLMNLSRFVVEICSTMNDSTTLILTSDHGNCEDITVKSHTRNPVPLLIYPKSSIKTPAINSITEVHDLIVKLLVS
jgi:bisphosphoglycerate-independent phosphoglycerate mutase (AlkP superfamily)